MQGSRNLPFPGQRVTSHIVGSDAGALLRQAEIQQLDSLFRDQNVGGLQIAVSEALAVRRVESVENLPCIFDRLLTGSGPLSCTPSINSITR